LRLLNGQDEELEVETFQGAGSNVAVKFKGLDEPQAVLPLKGAEVVVTRQEAAPLGSAEYYIEDLKGLRLEDSTGLVYGRVHDVLDAGGAFYLEIEGAEGSKSNAGRLVPFRKEFLGAVEPARGRIELAAPWVLE
jgi:16S rRNA processing protein RimM